MRPKALITRKIFHEVITTVKKHFDIEDNQSDLPFSPEELIKRLHGEAGAIILLTDRPSSLGLNWSLTADLD